MPRPYTPLTIDAFIGEDDTQPGTQLRDHQGSLVQNCYIVQGGLERRLGTDSLNGGTGSLQPIQGIIWTRIPDANPVERVVGVRGGHLYDFYNNGVQSSPTDLTGASLRQFFTSTSNNVGFAVVDSKLYAGDGSTDAAICYDGTTAAKAGCAKPTTVPTFNAFVGGGVLTGNVAYRVTYIDAFGNESEASDASAVMAPSAQNVTINIPNDTDADRTNKKLYRQGVASTDWKFVATLSASATTYTDSVADGSLGGSLSTIGQTLFPNCAYLWEHDNRLMGCGNAANPRVLYISTEFSPTVCPASPNLTLPTQGVQLRIQARNAKIVGGISHGAYCFIFTDEGGYILQGTSAEDYRIERFTNHGCSSHYSIQSVRKWVFWAGPEGIYRYDGLNVDRIDYAIRTFFTARSATDLSRICSWVYDDRIYWSFAGVAGQAGTVKCFDFRYPPSDGWTTMNYPDSWWHACSTTSNGGNVGLPRVFACNNTDGNVMQLEKPGVYLDNRAVYTSTRNITFKWNSKIFNMGLPGRDKRVHLWGFKARNPTTYASPLSTDLQSFLYLNGATPSGSSNAVQWQNIPFSTTATGDDWSAAPTSPSNVFESRVEATEQCRGELYQLSILFSGVASDFRLSQAELYYTIAG